jgi:PIN domain nuclease of toxin-antitoxin system
LKLLLDTQMLQMLTMEPGRLTRAEAQILKNERHSLAVSAVALWEMRLKWQTYYRSGDRKGEADPEAVVALLESAGVPHERVLLTFEHCTAMLKVPLDHGDGFDRLLLTQAQVEGMRLLTRDEKLADHPLALIA